MKTTRIGRRDGAAPSMARLTAAPAPGKGARQGEHAPRAMKVLTVVGNRPQFIKSGPVSVAVREAGIDEVVVHTGQHYDHVCRRSSSTSSASRSPAIGST